jgi:hypothetical protein
LTKNVITLLLTEKYASSLNDLSLTSTKKLASINSKLEKELAAMRNVDSSPWSAPPMWGGKSATQASIQSMTEDRSVHKSTVRKT